MPGNNQLSNYPSPQAIRACVHYVLPYRGEVAAFHPRFPERSTAVCREATGPVDLNAPDIIYTAEDDEAIEKFHRGNIQMSWHSLGTCAMKSRADQGVVDARLNVYGVTNLKVADLSIVPKNVGTNTYSTALIIGDKAAMIIAEDLGIEYRLKVIVRNSSSASLMRILRVILNMHLA